MKKVPHKEKAGKSIDISATAQAVNELTDLTAREERPEKEATKFINIRLKETDYKRLAKMAIDAGITKAAFCKFSSLYIADMVQQGAVTIGGGGIIDRRGR
jgi:hypothetical protein